MLRGEAPSKTLLVVGHGGLASKETLLPFCWEARRRGADCVAVDMLGHGASSPMPSGNSYAQMSRSLRVDEALAGYERVRYVGHSLGAMLGCGRAFGCDRCAGIGHPVPCPNVVWGAVHTSLGLPGAFYVLSHVLEPWTPSVVDRAVTLSLGPSPGPSPGARSRISLTIALAWACQLSGLVAGLFAARRVRAVAGLTGASRGALAAAAGWAGLVLGGSRTTWFLAPTQLTDLVVLAGALVPSLLITGVFRALGLRRPLVGALTACALSTMVACEAWLGFASPEMRRLLPLIPSLLLLLCPLVVAGERATRGDQPDAVEAAAFVATVLGLFVALLLPSVN